MTPLAADIWLTAEEIAEAALPGLPTNKRSVNRLAEKSGWAAHARKRAARGGGLEYPITVLSIEAQRVLIGMFDPAQERLSAIEAVMGWIEAGRSKREAVREVVRSTGLTDANLYRWLGMIEGLERDEWVEALLPPAEQARAAMQAANANKTEDMAREDGLAGMATLSETARDAAEARKAVLDAVDQLRTSGGLTQAVAREIFSESWNSEEDDFGLGAETRKLVERVSARSLRRWQKDFKDGGLAALAPKQGRHRKGQGKIQQNVGVRTIVEGMMVGHPGCSAKLIMRALRSRKSRGELGEMLPSYRTVQRYVDEWRAANAALFEMASSPDGYKSKMRLVSGKADEDVLRLNQRWEMDSTPNDVILSDGKRHSIIGVIDVWSRRVRMLVSRTSNSAAVAACMRRALLEWGVPEEIKTDNGSDYVSKHIKRIVSGLEIAHEICPPFSPERKPHIERFFKTFQHDLVELVDGFVGHSVEQRKRIEDRKAFAKRLGSANEEAPELLMSAEELQTFCDQWCDAIYEREKHSSLGMSPFARAQSWTGPIRRIENERALDVLLMPVIGDNGTRTVTKRGIQIDHHFYTDPALQPFVRRRVQVRLDEEDWGRVLVLSEGGEFICWALCPERAGVSRAEHASYMRAKGKQFEKDGRAMVRDLKKQARVETVAADILGTAVDEAGSILTFPGSKRDATHETDALAQGAVASKAKGKPRLVERDETAPTEADLAALDAAREAKAKRAPKPETPQDRFLKWERIDAAISEGTLMDDARSVFWRTYQKSAEFGVLRDEIKREGRAAVFGDQEENQSNA